MRYDLLAFMQEYLISTSGVKGQIVDFSAIPEYLGDSPEERVVASLVMRKQGTMLIDTTSGDAPALNTTFNGYDDTVDPNSIQAIELAMMRIEKTCSAITGVYEENLQGIEQRDAVANVQVGIQNSNIITKPLYEVINNVTRSLILDSINAFKLAYADGYTGVMLLGKNQLEAIKLDPKHYTLTDYGIFLIDSDEANTKLDNMKKLAPEFIKTGQVGIDIITKIIDSNSIEEVRELVESSASSTQQMAQQSQQLQQQAEQLQQQLKEMQAELKKQQDLNEQLQKKDLEIKQFKVQSDDQNKRAELENTKVFQQEKLKLEQARNELEKVQLSDGNARNDKIRNL